MRALVSQKYTANDLKQIDIKTEEKYIEIQYKLLELYPLFKNALDEGDVSDEVRTFLAEDLDDCYSTLMELKRRYSTRFIPQKEILCQKTFSEKLLVFLYSSMIKFCKTDKVKGIPLSKTFIENLKGIIKQQDLHTSLTHYQ